MINFLAEIAERFDTIILPTPSIVNKIYDIYEIDIDDRPGESFWTEYYLGTYFDTFTGTQIMLYFGQYLRPQSSMGDLFQTPYSMFITEMRGRRKCLINITRHPWLWPEWSTSFETVIPFLSNALNPENPSNNIIREENARTLLEVPNFTVKLSDNIAGISLNQGFSITLHNNNGYFDDEHRMNLFNTPLYLKKAAVENPSIDDFKMIRDGLVENTNTNFDRITISVADKFRALENPVYKVVKPEYLGYYVRESSVNRPIPLVFGTVRMRPIRINDNQYMTAENTTAVLGVFDRDGNGITGATLNAATGVLTVPAGANEATEVIITGNTDNRIGQIIKWLFENKASILFNETNFNVGEYNLYANNSFRVNIAITGGNVRRAIEDVLRNDMAFLVQQTDGRFTLRSYRNRNDYPVRDIPAWTITGKPERDFSRAQNNCFSSCIIDYVDNAGETFSEIYNDRANDAERTYRRRIQKTFDTRLTNKNDARQLASILSDRYTNMRQVIKLAVGINTAEFQLLDRVNVDIDINERKFSTPTGFIITSINHAQDILELEQI